MDGSAYVYILFSHSCLYVGKAVAVRARVVVLGSPPVRRSTCGPFYGLDSGTVQKRGTTAFEPRWD